MIPYIKITNKDGILRKQGYKYIVVGSNGTSDATFTFINAIRYWLWHCGIPMKYLIKK